MSEMTISTGFCTHLNPFYKAKDGAILQYDECQPDFLYKEPMYNAKDEKRLSAETKNLLLYSNRDYEKVKRHLQSFSRVEIPVSFLKINTFHMYK